MEIDDDDDGDQDGHDDESDDRLLNGLMDAMVRATGLVPQEPDFISDLVFPPRPSMAKGALPIAFCRQ